MTALLLLHHQHHTTNRSIIPVTLSRIQFLAQLQLENKLLLRGRTILIDFTQFLPLGLHVKRLVTKSDVSHRATQRSRSVPLVGVLDVDVNLQMILSKLSYIVHSLCPLERRTDNWPIVAVGVYHVLDLLEVWPTNKMDIKWDRSHRTW